MSLSKLFVHIVYHVKKESPKILPETEDRLYSYLGSIVKDNDSIPIRINGVDNHVHLLVIMSKNIALSKLVEEIKRHSSRWIKTQDEHYKDFRWRRGYGGFSVSPSIVEKTKKYIENQKEHHKQRDAKAELIDLLEKYDVDYDDRYFFD